MPRGCENRFWIIAPKTLFLISSIRSFNCKIYEGNFNTFFTRISSFSLCSDRNEIRCADRKFTSEAKQNLRVRVLNVIGEVAVEEDLQQFVGEYTKQINLNNYNKGIYLLEITTVNSVVNKKLIIH